MSEPLSSVEIEDVLSSIRRLVSEDMRPAPRGPALRVEPGRLDLGRAEAERVRPTILSGDKLILTPALRVVQDDASAIAGVVATLGAKVAEAPQDWESETGDIGPETLDRGAPEAAVDWSVEEPVAEGAAEVVVEEAAVEEAAVDQAVVDDAVVEGAATVDAATDDADCQPEAVIVETVVEATVEMVLDEVLPAKADEKIPGWAQTTAQEDDDTPRADPWDEATVEPDRAWADAAEAEALRELQAAPVVEEVSEDDALTDEMRFEEEVLRELVRDIIREELQGRLGERITRNIRKLVRAEVAQALAARDIA